MQNGTDNQSHPKHAKMEGGDDRGCAAHVGILQDGEEGDFFGDGVEGDENTGRGDLLNVVLHHILTGDR